MFKRTCILAIATLMLGFFLAPTVWSDCGCICDTNPEQCQSGATKQVREAKMKMGKNQHTHKRQKWVRIYLYEKDPSNWDIIGSGAWGFLDYRPAGTEFKFLFVGKKLEPFQEYTLIYYPDSWPGENLICLGSGTADELGKIKLVGKGDPANPDYVGPADTGDLSGAKIWLVLTSDVDCYGSGPIPPQMTGWTPEEYLFENTLITFVDTDD